MSEVPLQLVNFVKTRRLWAAGGRRIHFLIGIIRRTGLAPWKFEFPFPGRLTSRFEGTLPEGKTPVGRRRTVPAGPRRIPTGGS